MALASIGVLLAQQSKRVLLVDWDLEAPGLERYFEPSAAPEKKISITSAKDPLGLLGLLESLRTDSPIELSALIRTATLPEEHALDVLPSGSGAENYSDRLAAFSWPVSGGNDGAVRFWTPDLKRNFSIEIGIPVLKIAPAGSDRLAIGTGNGVLMLNIDREYLVRWLPRKLTCDLQSGCEA